MKTLLHSLLLLSGLCLPAGAMTLFEDNFESYPVGTPPTWTQVSNNPTGYVRVADAGAPFGSPNKYVDFHDVDSFGLLFNQDLGTLEGALTTMAFDYYEPTSATSNAPFNIGYTGNDINGTAIWRVSFDNGSIDLLSETVTDTLTYDLDTPYRFFIAVNDTLTPTVYNSPFGMAETLGAEEFDVYFQDLSDSTVYFAGTGSINAAAVPVTKFGFRSYSTGDQEVFLDNVLISSGVALVPEPSSLGLLGLGLAAVLLRRRRG